MQSQQLKPVRTHGWHLVCLAAALAVTFAVTARADSWNDKTILKFSAPVMVPGATLQPGSYVFKLMDSKSNRHTVQISTEDGSKVIALTQAVPTKRLDPKGDVVVKFNPTDAGSPPALKAWFYPGSIYGHEFIYPDDQAKQIAQRTKTLVLSTDVSGSDLEEGTLYTYDAAASKADWKGDANTMREWEAWQKNHHATAQTATTPASGSEARQQSTAPMVRGDFQGMRVKVDELEDNAQKYSGKTISVDAEIQDVLGPRLFTIDEPNWGDLDGEILVYMPTALAALVREDDRVTVTGTVKPFVKAEVEREWGWFGMNPEVEIKLAKKPVLVATKIVGGTNNTAMVIQLDNAKGTSPVGTSGRNSTNSGNNATAGISIMAISDLAKFGSGSDDIVGKHVSLSGVKVAGTAKNGGFFTSTSDATVFILPSSTDNTTVQSGETVSVEGVVLQFPRGLKDRLTAPSGAKGLNDDIYVYATNVSK
jgi:hypothetical protein